MPSLSVKPPAKGYQRKHELNSALGAPATGKKKAPCKFFAKGFCTKGDKCLYEHPAEHRVTASIETAEAVDAKELLIEPLPSHTLTTTMNGAIMTFAPGAVVQKLLLPNEYLTFGVHLSGKRSEKFMRQVSIGGLSHYWACPDRYITVFQPEVGKQVLLMATDSSSTQVDTTSSNFQQTFPGLALKQINTANLPSSDVVYSPAAAIYVKQRLPARQVSVVFRGVCKGLVLADPLPDGSQEYVTVDKASAQSRALRLQHAVTHDQRFGRNVKTRLERARLAQLPRRRTRPPFRLQDQNVWKLDIFGLNFSVPFETPADLLESNRNFQILPSQTHPSRYWLTESSMRNSAYGDSVYRVARAWGGCQDGTLGARIELRDAKHIESVLGNLNSLGRSRRKSGPRTLAVRIYVARIRAPRWLICALRKDILDLVSSATKQPKTTVVHVEVRDSNVGEAEGIITSKYSDLTIWSEEAERIGLLKIAIAELLRGRVITYEGEHVWHPYFASAPGLKYIAKLGHRKGIIILRQTYLDTSSRSSHLRLVGRYDNMDAIAKLLHAKIGSLDGTVYRLPLTDAMIAYGRAGAFQHIAKNLPRRSVMLRLFSDSQFLEIKGRQADLDMARGLLTVPPESSSSEQRSECPICFCDVEDGVMAKCRHSYCKSCFSDQCRQWDVAGSPVVCHGAGGLCSQAFGMDNLKNMLPSENFRQLLQSAFEGFVAKNTNTLRFCPTVECNHIYRITTERSAIRCEGCLLGICTKCKTSEHPEITCSENEDIHDEGKRLLNEWIETHNAKQCPTEGCSTIVEKNGGCDHMVCSNCNAHFCFKCLAVFPASQETYDHMISAHGHIGIEVPPDFAVNQDLQQDDDVELDRHLNPIADDFDWGPWDQDDLDWEEDDLDDPDRERPAQVEALRRLIERMHAIREPNRHERDADLAERLQDVELRVAGVID